jgi:hypothetical protein
VTGASTSTDTTAGVASAGVKVYDNGVNFEGNALTTIVTINGILVKCPTGAMTWTDGDTYVGIVGTGSVDERIRTSSVDISNPITYTALESSDITITVIGQTA